MGVTTALIYTPATFAKTDELIALSKVASQYGGMYTAHMRSEGGPVPRGDRRDDPDLARSEHPGRDLPSQGGRASRTGRRWCRRSRRSTRRAPPGVRITADMYTYTAGATGFDASHARRGSRKAGSRQLVARLKDPAIRAQVKREMDAAGRRRGRTSTSARARPTGSCSSASGPTRSSRSRGRRSPRWRRCAGKSPEETAMDLVIQDGARVGRRRTS